jgi:Holliday junction resolvasome RuvABC endonuclease subunit
MATASNDYRYALAIDPGFSYTGMALVKYDEDYIELVDFAYLPEPQNMKGESDCARVFDMSQNILGLSLNMITDNTNIHNWSLAIETAFYNKKNPRSVIIQSRLLQGIEDAMVLSLKDASDFVVVEYNPKTIKKCISGKGNATKTEVKNGVINKVKITKTMAKAIDELADKAAEAVYDATAIAYTHAAKEMGDEWE